MTKKILSLSLITFSALYASPSVAPINTGDILRQVQPVQLPMDERKIPALIQHDLNTSNKKMQQPKIQEEAVKPTSSEQIMEKNELLKQLSEPKQENTIKIKKFLFRGNNSIKADELRKVIADYNNRELTVQSLLDATDKITVYYRTKGFVNAQAYVYKKDIHEDTITITIAAKNHSEIMKDPTLLKKEDVSHSFSISSTKETQHDVQNTIVADRVRQAEQSEPQSNPIQKAESTLYVKEFYFSANSAFSTETLSELVKPYEGKELGINALKEVASVITKFYRDNGYFVARAYMPKQNMKDNKVEIAIIEGTYGAFDMKNSSLVDTAEVQGYMDYLKGGELVSTMSLERQMLIINDLSGAQVTNAEVYPGAEVGTSAFRITVSPTPKYSGYAIADNYGSRYTGSNRLSVGANINSLTGIGDTLSLTGLLSNTRDLKNIRLGYDRPLGYNGLKGGLSASTTKYTLSEITDYEGFGQTNSYNAYVAYPILKTRAHTQSVQLDYDHKNMKDTSGATGLATESQKSIDALTFKVSDKRNTSLLNLPGTLNASLGYTIGHLGLKNDNAKATDEAGLNSVGNYTKLTLNALQSQYLVEDTTLQSTFKAQKSFGHNLDSSEDLSVAGSNGVRAYEDSELSGDQGYALSLDLIYNLPKIDQVSHNTSLFLDHARIWKNTTIFNTEDNIRNLNALGVGYSLNFQNFDLKATLAHGFGSESTPTTEADISTNKNKFLVQGMMRF
ncbi:MAG: hypothetical protein JZU62_01605 [Sulfuricurvum sp.]|uniref:POTRA domain-containing protein n=1 Tax=Sulfuricurvum sp. TaxID=2025608 RepID=UPI0025ED89B4|nr:POTRA domain-containing protein [Sulfuricurvum sp.]MBV5320356.1 hypothetical protein [Sulfuricurvum sp.]